MTVAAPPKDAKIDWETLVTVDGEALAAKRDGKLDEPTFRAFWQRARDACGGQLALLETLRMVAEPGWIR
jgi:hypothetical protein